MHANNTTQSRIILSVNGTRSIQVNLAYRAPNVEPRRTGPRESLTSSTAMSNVDGRVMAWRGEEGSGDTGMRPGRGYDDSEQHVGHFKMVGVVYSIMSVAQKVPRRIQEARYG